MRNRLRLLLLLSVSSAVPVFAQSGGLTDMSRSPYAKIVNTPMGSVRWTGGFWGDRFGVISKTSVWDMWNTWDDPALSHGFRNFEVAAGTVKGTHKGPPFHDGDMYKWLEGCAAVYAVTKDPKLDKLMDRFIEQVAKAQRADGYIHTPVVIDERNKGVDSHAADHTVIGITVGGKNEKGAFASRLNFETYNLGHLMTAGIVHKRATGKNNLFQCAVRAADFLYRFLKNDRDELARNAICPSHYMGAAEMYRMTGDARYFELAKELIAIRDSVKNGEDHNQDRVPFRQQYEAMGHAVRANYLYAGVADLYAETGEQQLFKNLSSIWDDIANHKIYITGGCGALYDGVSPDGTTYDQPSIQQIHQAYGRQFQLPNESSHNETCAQIGELLYSWRLFQTTGDSKYVDMVENELYNGILPGISLDGKSYFYTQALRKNQDFPYVMRWPKSRQRYISCFCCPPNTLRTLAEAQEYAYSMSKDGQTLYVNLYGDNRLRQKNIDIEQVTGYPYDGRVVLRIRQAKGLRKIMMRLPGWTGEAGYRAFEGGWKKGDSIVLDLPMRARLIEANPLVEESKNQVAVKRGPIVYCLESVDIADRADIDNVVIPADIKLDPVSMTIDGHTFVALEGEAQLSEEPAWDRQTLYREVNVRNRKVRIRLTPYYAWGNRGDRVDMTVWMNLKK